MRLNSFCKKTMLHAQFHDKISDLLSLNATINFHINLPLILLYYSSLIICHNNSYEIYFKFYCIFKLMVCKMLSRHDFEDVFLKKRQINTILFLVVSRGFIFLKWRNVKTSFKKSYVRARFVWGWKLSSKCKEVCNKLHWRYLRVLVALFFPFSFWIIWWNPLQQQMCLYPILQTQK